MTGLTTRPMTRPMTRCMTGPITPSSAMSPSSWATPRAIAGGALVIAALAIGCGGPQQGSSESSGSTSDTGRGGGGASPPSDMIPPELMDEVTRNLQRKGAMVSRCLSAAVDNKELPKSSSGKVTLQIIISPSGRADTVNIVRASLESKTLDECIVRRVKEIQFPELPGRYETSHTYGFEAM